MCVSARIWTMGCGKSRHHSPDVSEIDLRNSGSLRNSSGDASSHKAAGKRAKTRSSRHDSGLDNDAGDGPSSVKKASNGKTRPKDKNKDSGISLSSSSQSSSSSSSLAGNKAAASPSTRALVEKSNGATKPQGTYYLLEVPNEVYKAEASSKVTSKDVKTSTSTKTVHVTTSQLEFFKMLDEKIEMGGDYHTSNEASEVSSVDDTVRQ